MLTRHLTFAVVALAASLQVACFPDYFPRHKAKDVTDSEVSGTWQLRPASAEKFLAYPVSAGTKSTAEFSSDGHCSLSSLVYNGDLYSGEGTWKLAADDDRGGSRFSVLEILLPSSSGGRPDIFTFYFAREHKRLILWEYIGDPDSREYIEYERMPK
jgi:hypothetical protein